MLFKYKPNPKHFVECSKGNMMFRMVTVADGGFRMGLEKFSVGVTYERPMWFEVFYIVKGKMSFKYRSYIPPERGQEKTLEVNAGEAHATVEKVSRSLEDCDVNVSQ